jgi:hypothetical protein
LLLAANGRAIVVHGVQCRGQPEPAQYNGGILRYSNSDDPTGYKTTETGVLSPAFVVYDLNKTTMYTFSGELCRSLSKTSSFTCAFRQLQSSYSNFNIT